jgi:hypothetical protein
MNAQQLPKQISTSLSELSLTKLTHYSNPRSVSSNKDTISLMPSQAVYDEPPTKYCKPNGSNSPSTALYDYSNAMNHPPWSPMIQEQTGITLARTIGKRRSTHSPTINQTCRGSKWWNKHSTACHPATIQAIIQQSKSSRHIQRFPQLPHERRKNGR